MVTCKVTGGRASKWSNKLFSNRSSNIDSGSEEVVGIGAGKGGGGGWETGSGVGKRIRGSGAEAF